MILPEFVPANLCKINVGIIFKIFCIKIDAEWSQWTRAEKIKTSLEINYVKPC